MTKKISPIQAREQEFEKIVGVSHKKFLTGVLMGAVVVDIDPEFTLWCVVRDARRKSDKPVLDKKHATAIVKRKFGKLHPEREYYCDHPLDGKKYVFCVMYKDKVGIIHEESRGPSWEAAIDAAVKEKRGEQ